MFFFTLLEFLLPYAAALTAVLGMAALLASNDCHKLRCFVAGVTGTVVVLCHWCPYDVELNHIVVEVKEIGTLEREKVPTRLQRVTDRLEEYKVGHDDMVTTTSPLSKLIQETEQALQGDSTKTEEWKKAMEHMEYYHLHLPAYWAYKPGYRHLLAVVDVAFLICFITLVVLVLKDSPA